MSPKKPNGVPGKLSRGSVPARPDVFTYHDHRAFLKDWFAYLKASGSGPSLRECAKKSGLSSAYLPLVLQGKRKLSANGFEKLGPHLGLHREETEYLSQLRGLGESDSPEVRRYAFEAMKNLRSYRKANPAEVEVYHYLDNWYHVAIREMVNLPNFSDDPQWIAAQLGNRITAVQAANALKFLLESNLIQRESSGRITAAKKNLNCEGGVYRLAIGSFHRQMIETSAQILDEVKSDELRHVMSYTLALNEKDFGRLRDLINKGIDRVEETERKTVDPTRVYHVTMMAVPLTVGRKEEK